MAAPLILVPDVETWIGEEVRDSEQVEALIVYASARLRRLVPSLDSRMADWANDPSIPGALDPELVKGAMSAAIGRALDPADRRLKSVEYPEVKETYADSDPDYSAVYFTDQELADLAPVSVGGNAFTITPSWRS